MAMHGIIFLMIRRISVPIIGVRTAWQAYPTFFRISVLLWPCGLGNKEGNHGEDVKELYYYLDNTPTHYYMEYLYKYPQQEFPYKQLLEENRRRSREEPEYEILDTGVLDK